MESRNGYRIEAALKLRNISQKELAEHLGQKPNVISYWCSGARTPNTTQLAEIARFLNVSADYLLGLTEEPTTDSSVKAITNLTGLTEKALISLIDLKRQSQMKSRSFPPLLSLILGHRSLQYLMGLLEGYAYSGDERKHETLETMSVIEYRQRDFILAAINATVKDILDEIAIPFLEENIPTEVKLQLKHCEIKMKFDKKNFEAGKISEDEYKKAITENQKEMASIKKQWESKREEIINGKHNPSKE